MKTVPTAHYCSIPSNNHDNLIKPSGFKTSLTSQNIFLLSSGQTMRRAVQVFDNVKILVPITHEALFYPTHHASVLTYIGHLMDVVHC